MGASDDKAVKDKKSSEGRGKGVVKLILAPATVNITFLYLLYYCSAITVAKFGVFSIFHYPLIENSFSLINFFFSICSLACLSILFCSRQDLPAFFINFMLGVIYVPALVIYTISVLPDMYCLLTLFACLVVAFIGTFVKFPAIRISNISSSIVAILCLVGTLCIIVIIVIMSNGLSQLSFNFAKIYKYRIEFRNLFPPSLSRAISIVSMVFIPFGIVVFLLKRNWLLFMLFFFLSTALFGLTSRKAILFFPFAVLGVYLIVSFSRSWVFTLLCGLLAIILISGVELFCIMKHFEHYSPWFSSLAFRRALLVPSIIDYYYLDYFDWHNMVYWSGNKFVTFGLIPPRSPTAPFLIGTYYFNRPEISANVGWIGSGYANMGMLGVFFYSVLIGLVLSLLNSYAKLFGNKFTISVSFIPVSIMLTSSDFFTVVYSGGLLFVFLFLSLLSPDALGPVHTISTPQRSKRSV